MEETFRKWTLPKSKSLESATTGTGRCWDLHQADILGRQNRRLEEKLHCWGCGPKRRFKYITVTTRVDRLLHVAGCAVRSAFFLAIGS